MATSARWRAVWVGGALVLAVAAVALPHWPLFGSEVVGTAVEEVLEVDPAQRAALLEAADRFLETDPDRNGRDLLRTERPELGPRTFCREEFVEVRRKDPHLLLGIVASCMELARSGDTLVAGSGFGGPLLLTVERAGGRYAVREVREPLDGDRNLPSIREMFSPEGAPRAVVAQSDGGELHEAVVEEARRVFGLPAGTELTYLSMSAYFGLSRT
ncbi:hypothetical protein [Nonomuraea gerenzanensis]|nr:hypothetical protein [Nonomuraea gerenzanensis]UBU13397.1 hypothetical protein LCN96_55765 [Nonomuraea gerenzanensis]